jgi:glycosyltransferase involved in cell wall biosynthesis
VTTWAVIPAYDAADTIAAVVEGTRRHVAPVAVVDDGSHDATGDVARGAGAVVIRHPTNRGKGAALQTGFRHAVAHGATRVVTLDADGQHLPDEIPTLLATADAHPDAIVVGEREKSGHAIRRIARFGNWVADTLLRAFAGRRLPDTQSGFRVYPAAATSALGAAGSHFEFETEVLLRAARAGIDIVGVPVRVYYPPPDERVTHYDPWRDTLRIIAVTLRVSLASRRAAASSRAAS